MSKTEHNSFAGLLGGKSDSAVPLPAPATTASYNLTPGAYTQFLFRMNDVQDVALDQTSGALRMNLANGSVIVVQNFKDLARSAETCGRDTVLQFMRDETSATGQATTKIVNIAPDLLLKTLDPTASPDGLTILSMPPSGVTREVVVVPGGKYRFDFDWAGAAKTEDGTNVMLSFKNGGLVILRDFVPVMQGDMPAKMSLTDGTVIDASKLIVTACTPSETPLAKLAAIEPASGERHETTVQPHRVAHKSSPDMAAKVASIEPAAGDGTPGQSGNRGSAGFSSGIDDAGFNGVGRLGPLGPTSLTYGTPRLPDQIVLRGDATVAPPVIPPVLPPPAPDLVAQDSCVYEDGSVGLSVTTTAPVGTTTVLTISGFPAEWSVDAGLGTFNATTRVWTINIPSGATFTGGPVIHPPANSDRDIPKLDVHAVATSTITGLSSNSTEDIRVVTDAVADMPNLTASIINITGMIANLSIITATTDLDGSEKITAVYVGPLPTGVTLDKGVLQSDGRYLLNPSDLSGVHVVAPVGYNGTINFNVTTVVTESNLSDAECDLTNNTAIKTVPVSVQFVTIDGTPTIGDSLCVGDETILNRETLWFTGDYAFNYGSDGAGAVTLDQFVASGSMMNGVLSSGGVPVVVTTEGSDFVGRAGNVVVFKMMVNTAAATYRFEQYQALDHQDGSNPDDVIALDFGIKITDRDGDTDTGTLRITLADDAPIARDDTAPAIVGGGIATGNVLTNDTRGADDVTVVTSVSVNGVTRVVSNTGNTVIDGAFGTLTIASNGAYTYGAKNGANGGDTFTYTIRDFDGDQSTATLSFGTSDGTPTIGDSLCVGDETILNRETLWFTGDYAFNYGSDGAGAVTLDQFVASGSMMNGVLSSGGVPVVVTTEGSDFVGRAGNVVVFKMMVNTAAATYRFEQYQALDHQDGSNPDDVIALDFGIKITDRDGDTDTGTLRITLADDAPIARDDTAPAIVGGGIATGNVLTNDTRGADDVTVVTSVTANGVTRAVGSTGNTVIDGAFGSLTIASNGTYSYNARNGSNGGDVFTYTIRDFDGDTSLANLTIGTADGVPTIGDASGQVDETNLWAVSATRPIVTGQLNSSFGADGAGTILPAGVSSFSAVGSLTNNQLTMSGLPVVVTLVGNTYKGQVTWPDDGTKGDIFDLIVNTDGSYEFKLYNTLDHVNVTNPNDVITLNFGVNISDRDGDTDTGVISINVLDDAPIARDDSAVVNAAGIATGNVINNDYYSYDDMQVTSVTVNGITMTPPDDPDDGRAILVGTYGTFSMDSNGVYTYTARNGVTGSDILTYTLTDIDGDQSTARLTVGINDGIPTIGDDTRAVDETNLGPITVSGALAANYGTDGAGSITARANSFSAAGSLRNGALSANGQDIAVTLSGNTWTGSTIANGALASVVLFTLVLNNNGTYAFTLNDNLDHAAASNPNDIITLNFGAVITDRDGDTDTGTITINVIDDAPIARDDTVSASFNNVGTGNVLSNDTSTEDPVVTLVTFNGQSFGVSAGVATTVRGDHGVLTMNADGAYTYRPDQVQSENICVYPVQSDVAAANDSDFSRNGITVTAINPNTRAVTGDLTWISGNITDPDKSWYGEQGVGIAGAGSNFINGRSEGLRLAFDVPQSNMTITISGFNSMSDFVDGVTEQPLNARVYLSGAINPIEITLQNGWSSGFGLTDYTLTSGQFGGQKISSVEMFSTQANADWNLYNVAFDLYGLGGTDVFGYTATDRDGDAASAFLRATNTTLDVNQGAKTLDSVLETTDAVQLAINDYVVSTTDSAVFTTVQGANDSSIETAYYLSYTQDDQHHQNVA